MECPRVGTRSNDATPRMTTTKALKAHQNKGVGMSKTYPDNPVENNPNKGLSNYTNRRTRQNITKVIDIDIACIKF
jgi:hypothetical protein